MIAIRQSMASSDPVIAIIEPANAIHHSEPMLLATARPDAFLSRQPRSCQSALMTGTAANMVAGIPLRYARPTLALVTAFRAQVLPTRLAPFPGHRCMSMEPSARGAGAGREVRQAWGPRSRWRRLIPRVRVRPS
jgi:hypothetical protein